ncbi:hypothetical protein BD311DRAFT_125160 [Dichomitus squalens]|uniref:Uncharacterized protein n=1 Tax=Dichomitus squalens TaxID=114155 RepID=A0A4Q9M740_9APHY|nr:hypothetical protein BD311DRAFT_125160 [Dichomitus squalens]
MSIFRARSGLESFSRRMYHDISVMPHRRRPHRRLCHLACHVWTMEASPPGPSKRFQLDQLIFRRPTT